MKATRAMIMLQRKAASSEEKMDQLMELLLLIAEKVGVDTSSFEDGLVDETVLEADLPVTSEAVEPAVADPMTRLEG